jgi:hypothetical protein
VSLTLRQGNFGRSPRLRTIADKSVDKLWSVDTFSRPIKDLGWPLYALREPHATVAVQWGETVPSASAPRVAPLRAF